MTVSLNLPSEMELTLRERAASSGLDVASFVEQIVTESLIADSAVPVAKIDASEFAKRLESWIALHPVREHAVDDSRESIYGGRGE